MPSDPAVETPNWRLGHAARLFRANAWGAPDWVQAIVIQDASRVAQALAADPACWNTPHQGHGPLGWALLHPRRAVLEAVLAAVPPTYLEKPHWLAWAAQLGPRHARGAVEALERAGAPVSEDALGHALGAPGAWGKQFFLRHARRVFPSGPWRVASHAAASWRYPALRAAAPAWTCERLARATALMQPGSEAGSEWMGAWGMVVQDMDASAAHFEKLRPWAQVLRDSLRNWKQAPRRQLAHAAFACAMSPGWEHNKGGTGEFSTSAQQWLAQAWVEDFSDQPDMMDLNRLLNAAQKNPGILPLFFDPPGLREQWDDPSALVRLLVFLDLLAADKALPWDASGRILGAVAPLSDVGEALVDYCQRLERDRACVGTVGVLAHLSACRPQAFVEGRQVQERMWKRIMLACEAQVAPEGMEQALAQAGWKGPGRDWRQGMCQLLLDTGASPQAGLEAFLLRAAGRASSGGQPPAPEWLALVPFLLTAGASWPSPAWVESPQAPAWVTGLRASHLEGALPGMPASGPRPRM